MSELESVVENLVKNYSELSARLKALEQRVASLEKDDKKFLNSIKKLENRLKQTGHVAPSGKLLSGGTINVYFPVPRSEFKQVRELGLKPAQIPMMENEHKLFYTILRERGINLPDKVILGRLSKPSYIMGRRYILMAKVPQEFVYVGDRDTWYDFLYSTNRSERQKLIKTLAKSIKPLSSSGKTGIMGLDLALVTVPIPAKSLEMIVIS